MRRLFLTGLLLTAGCLAESAPNTVAQIQVGDNAGTAGTFVGDRVQLTVYTFDIQGNVLGAPVTFTSANQAVATITSTGLITALIPGSTVIGVSSGNAKVNLSLAVDGNVAQGVLLAPNAPIVPLGTTQIMVATVLTTLSNPARGKSLIWTTTDASKVGVDQTGKVIAIALTPSVTVCAAVSDAPTIKGCTTITVQ